MELEDITKRAQNKSRHIQIKYSPFLKSPLKKYDRSKSRYKAVSSLDNLFGDDSSDEEVNKPTKVCVISAKDVNTL